MDYDLELETLKHDLRNRDEDCRRVRDALLPLYPDEPGGEKIRAGWLAQHCAAPEIERLREENRRLRGEVERTRAEVAHLLWKQQVAARTAP